MPAINSATVTALYLFDVAEQIDLGALRMAIGGAAASAKFTPGRGAPSYLQYANPPLVVDGDVLQLGEFDGFKLRLKFFDYGVLSLALTRPFAGDWPDLVVASQRYIENEPLEERAEACCRRVVDRFVQAMRGTRERLLAEDYLVLAVTSLASRSTAENLLSLHGKEIAQIVRGETQPLSVQEQDDILKESRDVPP